MHSLADVYQYLAPASVEVFLCAGILVLLMAGLWRKKNPTTWLLSLGLGVCLCALTMLWWDGPIHGSEVTFNGYFVHDHFTQLVKCVVLICVMCVIVSLYARVRALGVNQFELSVLLLMALLGMCVFISSNDFLTLYLGVELQSLALYILVAICREGETGFESVIKYFVLGGVASAFMIFGISLLYGYSGTTSFFVIEDILSVNTDGAYGFYVGISFLLAGLAFKVSAAPFHMWTPDVYQGSSYSILTLLATAPKLAALGFLMRFLCGPFYGVQHIWQPLILGMASISIIWGAFAALRQTHIRRFLAYASISSIGFALVGLGMATEMGLRATLFYILLYLIAMIGLLTCIILLKRKHIQLEDISDLRGLAQRHPIVALAISLFILNMAGLPPLPGFFGKLFLLQSALNAHHIIIPLIMVLVTVITSAYYLVFLKRMFFDAAPEPTEETPHDRAYIMSGLKLGDPLVAQSFIARSILSLNYIVVFASILFLACMLIVPKYLFHWAGYAVATFFYT